ncbi:MAG: hypothetical protein PHE06_15005 [Lachnospiraceae bacterium]|nr:hypothetical protein [Lachnospiraceae bacterium]
MKENVRDFLEKHGMARNDAYENYHMSLGYYYAYSSDAFVLAEMVEDGEVFDEREVCIIIQNLYDAHQTLLYFQEALHIQQKQFNTAETIVMSESKIEHGKVCGKIENAVKTARTWLKRFLKNSEPTFRRSPGEMREKSISRDLFLYEVAIFILYLTGEEVDYTFLERGREKNVYYG